MYYHVEEKYDQHHKEGASVRAGTQSAECSFDVRTAQKGKGSKLVAGFIVHYIYKENIDNDIKHSYVFHIISLLQFDY